MLIIPIKINNGIKIGDAKLANQSFKDIGLKEPDIEEFLRKNIGEIFDGEETLLIVGQQVSNEKRGRSDLTAIDKNGSIVLIEIKRDIKDTKGSESQAIRYVASCATIKTPEELVEKIFSRYIERYKDEFGSEELTTSERGRRILNKFLKENEATKKFNHKQRIILIASSFDPQTESAVAWLISNNVDISCFTIRPIKIDKQTFLQVDKILPPQPIEDFYVDISKSKLQGQDEKLITGSKRAGYPKIPKLFEWGILKKGVKLSIKGYDNSEAEVVDEKKVKFNDEELTYNQWGMKVTGWAGINIYTWVTHVQSRKTLNELRMERMEQDERETSDNTE